MGRASEARRCRMAELFQDVTEIRENPTIAIARHWDDHELQARLELINLLEKERLFQIELGNQYHCVSTFESLLYPIQTASLTTTPVSGAKTSLCSRDIFRDLLLAS